MEYVSKDAVLAAIEDWAKCFSNDEAIRTNPEKVINLLIEDVSYMDADIDTELDITELLFREKRAPIKVNARLTLCPTCRKQLKDGHSYCKKCGQAILRKKGDDANDSSS